MITYYLIFLYLAFQSFYRKGSWINQNTIPLIIFLTLFIGLRHQVGGDWGSYMQSMQLAKGVELPSIIALLKGDESGYFIFEWIGANVFGGIYLVNTLCAFIFSVGLVLFCRNQPRPWLALLIAFPYLVIMVAMGYTRQGVSIGLEMLALLAIQNRKFIPFFIWIAIASTFHKTSLLILLLPAFLLPKKLKFIVLIRIILILLAGYGIFSSAFSSESVGVMFGYYESFESKGAYIRVGISLVYSIAYLFTEKKYQLAPASKKIWRLMSFATVIFAIALLAKAPTSMIDRLALYVIPIQMVVGSSIPYQRILGISQFFWKEIIVFASVMILTIWLFFGDYSVYWVPYNNLLFPYWLF